MEMTQLRRTDHAIFINKMDIYFDIYRNEHLNTIIKVRDKFLQQLEENKKTLEAETKAKSQFVTYFTNKVKHKQEVIDGMTRIIKNSYMQTDFFLDELYTAIYGDKANRLSIWNLLEKDQNSIVYKLHQDAHTKLLPTLAELDNTILKDFILYIKYETILPYIEKYEGITYEPTELPTN